MTARSCCSTAGATAAVMVVVFRLQHAAPLISEAVFSMLSMTQSLVAISNPVQFSQSWAGCCPFIWVGAGAVLLLSSPSQQAVVLFRCFLLYPTMAVLVSIALHGRPSPPYILWCKDQWNELKKANPKAEFKDISTILGTKWKTVTAEEKKPYQEKYQAEKEAYLKVVGNEKRENEAMKLLEEEQKQRTAMELLEQYLQFKQEAEKETKKKKKQKDPLKPKQPMSAFFIFANAQRAALVAENKSVVEVAKITGEEWKNMTEKQKRPYEKIANKNKEKYAEEMEAYKQKKEEEAINLKKEDEEQMKIQKQEALQLLKKKEKAENIIKKTKENRQKKKQQKEEKNADPNKPKKPASSFILFSKETRKNLMEERPGINNSTLNALISVKWKELREQDKLTWNEKAAKAMEAYKKELEEYNKIAEVKGKQ